MNTFSVKYTPIIYNRTLLIDELKENITINNCEESSQNEYKPMNIMRPKESGYINVDKNEFTSILIVFWCLEPEIEKTSDINTPSIEIEDHFDGKYWFSCDLGTSLGKPIHLKYDDTTKNCTLYNEIESIFMIIYRIEEPNNFEETT